MSYPTISIGLANKLCDSAVKQGLYPMALNMIAEHPMVLADALAISKGLARVVYNSGVISCAGEPFIPEGFIITKHVQASAFESRLLQYNCAQQINLEDYKKMQNANPARLANACVLDYLISHQAEIPDAWKLIAREGKAIYFLGTEYGSQKKMELKLPSLVVRYLAYNKQNSTWIDGIGQMYGMEKKCWTPFVAVYPG